jgi:outer membrane protein TolC
VQDLAVAERQAFYLPTLTTTFNNSSRTSPSSTQLDGGQSVSTDTATFNSAISQAVPWGGGSFDVGWNNNRTETTNFFSSFNPSYRTTFDATYTQPLLRGFQIDEARQQLRITRINRDISDLDLREVINTTVAQVHNAYWDLVYASETLDVQRQALALAEKLVQDNQARVEIGTMAPIEVVQARSEAAARRQSLAQAEQTLRTAELALKRLIVGGTDDELWDARLSPVDVPGFSPVPIDVTSAIRTAFDQRADLARMREQLGINDINLGALRNETLPALDVVGNVQLQGQGGTQFSRSGLGGSVLKVIPGSFGDALSQLARGNFPVWSVQLRLTYPLGQSSAQVAYARARLETQQTQAQLRQLELEIATEVANAAQQLDSIVKRIDAATAARELAEQRLQAEQSKFEVGLSTNFFIVQAQRDLATAQDAELRAIVDYQKAATEFQRVQHAMVGRARQEQP